jgi:hypothetical protein
VSYLLILVTGLRDDAGRGLRKLKRYLSEKQRRRGGETRGGPIFVLFSNGFVKGKIV